MTIKNDITVQIDADIDSMSVATGYNNDYDNVNEYKPGTKTYPNVKTEYEEEGFEDPEDQVVDSYSANLRGKFTVTVDDTVAVRLALSQVLEDFQRLFDSEHAALQTKGLIDAELLSDLRSYTHVRARPGVLTMEWNLIYRVKRSNPAVTT